MLIASSAPAQNLFEADFASGNVYEYTPGGAQSTFASGVYPYGLAFDSAGDLFVADGGSGNVYEYTPGGAQSTFASGVSPYGLAFDSAGNLYVSDYNTRTIYKYTSGGVKSTFASGFDAPRDLAFDSTGNLYVADQDGGTITEITPGGAQSTFASGLSEPIGLAFNSAGDLFVSEAGGDRITEITPGGAQSTFVSSGLSAPEALAFNSAGNLFEADYNTGTINEFTPGGAQSTFASGLSDPSSIAFWPVTTNSCTNGCIIIYNPNDITVTTCSNSLPVNFSVGVADSCCSNYPVVTVPPSGYNFPLGTTTVISAATDICGNSNSCSFTVTVLPGTNCATNCLQIQCPTNKTASCATNWSFDFPIVLSSCCGTNYSISVYGSDVSSNIGPCSMNITRTWLITDCSGQASFCSQTVTVSPPSSYTLMLQPGTNLIAYQFTAAGANVVFQNGGNLDFDELDLYDCAGYTDYFFDSGSPSGFDDANGNPLTAAPILSPGAGMFYVNNSGSPETITITGTPVCPPSPSPLCPCGTPSLVSYELDCPGTYEDITGLQPQQGVQVLLWNGTNGPGYTTNTFTGGTWTLGPPVLNVGEAAFILIPCATNCLQIQCWTNMVVTSCANVPVYYYPTATDTCCSNWSVVCNPASGSLFSPGTVTTVMCLATDSCGNSNTCSFTVTVQRGCVTPPANMVLWLPFDEKSGTTSVNLAPGGNNGTQVGGPGVVLGAYVDNSLNFNGTINQYVSVPDYPAIDIGTNDFTIDAWVNRATNGPNSYPSVIVDKRDVNTGAGYSLALSYGALILAMTSNYEDTGARIVQPDGLWHFVAVSVSQSTGQVLFYIDGRLNSTLVVTPTSVSNTNALWVGGSLYGDINGNDRHWTGDIDEVEVYNRALSTNELYAIYSAGACGKCKPPCATEITVTCPTNKTVQCGVAWTFDLPAASSCCGSNVAITVTGTVTNGVCPKVVTRTWLLTDACGNTSTCSQTVTQVSCVPPPSGMVNWWPGDSNTLDIVGGNNGTINGSVTYASGMVGPAFDFNGSGGWVQSTGVGPSQPAGTVDFWFNANSWNPASNGMFLWANTEDLPNSSSSFDGMNFGNHPQYSTTAQLMFGIYGSSGWNWAFSGVVPQPNTWYHVAGTWGPGGIQIYVNGVLKGSNPYSGPSPGYTHYNLIGRSSWPNTQINGLVDEVEIFNRALATSEIASIYAAGPAGKCKSPELICTTNKTVQCGTSWTFDLPMIDSCGGGTGSLVVVSTVTNGICPMIVTRDWLYVDACGFSNTCSQMVTVVNTNPPVINCPSNIVVVSCTNVPVCYSVTASTACCSNVTVVCTPPSCSYFAPGTVTTVNCVATDCCGNSNTCSFTVTVQEGCVTPPANMVLWLPFDETAGPISANIAPVLGANNGLQVGGPGVVLGAYVDNSLNFGGTPKQYVSVPDYPAIDIGTNDFTIDAWVNRATNGPNSYPSVIVDKRDVNTGAGYSLALSYGHPVLAMSGFVTEDTGLQIVRPDGQWHFLAVSVSQSTLTVSFYIDGVLLTSTVPRPASVYNLANTNALWVAGSPYGDINGNDRHWTGDIDEVEVYNRALSSNELFAIYGAGACGKCKSPCTNIVVICPSPKTVPCGSAWTFDLPAASSCCGSNVNTTVVSTVTNGVCLINFTGGGSTAFAVVNFVGNTAISGYLDITAGSKVGTYPLSPGSGADSYFYWDGQVFPGSNPFVDVGGLLFTGGGFEINLFGNGPGSYSLIGAPPVYAPNVTGGVATMSVCPQTITRTWQFTDDCGHTNTCSQTVTVVNNTPPVLNCASNKTVQCGSAWSFDAPTTAFDACSGSNVVITVASTVTNGVCPRVITRTWLATDACGNTNTCSQMVTVVDTTPPVITCQTNTVVVELNASCQLVIPLIQASATDNCTPASQLVYTQTPTNGTVVSGTSHYVTVIVTDLCGNSNQCQVLVSGRYPPPVIICPGIVSVTNCVMPNVLPLVGATGCNGGKPFVFSQSPLPGTALGPGSDTVTVTVTGQGGSDSCIIALQFPGPSSFLNQLYNTGVDNNRHVLPVGTIDPHYTPVAWPGGVIFSHPGKYVAVNYPWFVPPGSSEWISPANNVAPWTTGITLEPYGYYTNAMNSFVLPAGADPNTASIYGRWAADDFAWMYLNGNQVSFTTAGFAGWTYFTISGPGLFLPYPNPNTITFDVFNSVNYTGFRVEMTNAVAGCSTCAPPTVVWMTPNQSLPAYSKGTFTANVAGTGPFTYQWYHNGVAISGATGPTLTIGSLSYANAGSYYVIVSNSCGRIQSQTSKLTVTLGWPWNWGWWNFTQPGNPMAATFGPDLVLSGSNVWAIASGTADDFGISAPQGGVADVMYVAPLTPDTSIQIPLIAAPGSNSVNSYTVIMDIYEPDTSLGTPSTFFQSIPCCVSNLGSSGQDGVALTLDASNNLHLAGSAAAVPFDTGPAANLAVDAWNRVAMVVDDPQDGVAVNLGLYLNGQQVGSLTVPTPVGLPINWNNNAPTLFSVQTNAVSLNGALFACSIQFHAVALTPQQLAGMGSPGTGPIPADDTSVGQQPVLAASQAGGSVSFSWAGSSYVLQETTSLSGGEWVDSALPFTETGINGGIMTTAVATPVTGGPVKFYRLIFNP